MKCVLDQHDETIKKERAIYYLSKKFIECESRYIVIIKKAMLCTNMGRKKITTLYIVSLLHG